MKKGLFITRHRGEISKVVDVDALARMYPDLDVVRVYDQLFEPADLRDILYRAKEHRLDAVVVAGYSSHLVETSKIGMVLIDALRQIGVNQNRVVFTNIYEQAALIHADQPSSATRKARLLIDTALTKAEVCQTVETVSISPQRAVMVAGLTEPGLTAVEQLLSKDIEVLILSKKAGQSFTDLNSGPVDVLHQRVRTHPKARLFYESEILDMAGWAGDYKLVLATPHGEREVSVGGILLCLDDDHQWREQLRPIMHLDTDRLGYLVNATGSRYGGETKDAGIWFLPPGSLKQKAGAITTGVAAAVNALSELVGSPRVEHPLLVSAVDASLCGGCGTCIKTCAFAASTIDVNNKTAIIDPRRCRGCGNCVTACPTSARDLATFPTLYVNRAIKIMSQGASTNEDPKILAFLCKNSGRLAINEAGRQAADNGGGAYSPNVMPLIMECGGNIDTVYLLKAFKEGFEGVALVVCRDGHCHNLVGNTDMERRVGLLRAVLRSRRMDDNRMRIIHTYGHDGQHLLDELNDFSRELRQMRPVYA